MCGLIYLKRKDGRPAYKSVLKRYRQQEHRGRSGYGYVAIENNRVVSYQRATTEKEIVALLERERASEIFFHHRQPTSVPNIIEAAHPIHVQNAEQLKHTYYILHNGVIRNKEELYKAHTALGFRYSTQIQRGYLATATNTLYDESVDYNDSESLAIDTALLLEGKQERFEASGVAAVIGLQVAEDGTVLSRFFFRNEGNPLYFFEDSAMVAITSIGKGTTISTDGIKVLHPSGGYRDLLRNGKMMWTPFGWRSHYSSSSSYESWRKKDEDFSADIPSARPRYIPLHEKSDPNPPKEVHLPLLPSKEDRESSGGFSPFSRKERKQAKQRGFVTQWNIEEKLRQIKNVRSLVLLNDDDIWAHYDLVLTTKELIQEYLSQTEKSLDSNPSDELFTMGEKMAARLTVVEALEKAVERECTRRAALSKEKETPTIIVS